MRTTKLNTGVIITFDKYDNMIEVNSPYYKNGYKKTVLRAYVDIIKSIIN